MSKENPVYSGIASYLHQNRSCNEWIAYLSKQHLSMAGLSLLGLVEWLKLFWLNFNIVVTVSLLYPPSLSNSS
jgi:hypothetical protein